VKVSKLKPKNRNPRKIDQPAIDRLKASITDFPAMMELRPIVYDPDTMEVIGGNQRLAAIKSMGMKEIPDTWAISAEKLTPDEKKRFVLQDNHQSGDWDFDILADDFGDMLDEIGIVMPTVISPDDFDEEFSLPTGDKEPFQQMTFTLADAQAETIKAAIDDIKHDKPKIETYGNENSNGNALYEIVRQWAEQKI